MNKTMRWISTGCLCFFVTVSVLAAASFAEVTVTIYNTGDIHERTQQLARISQFVKDQKAKDKNVLFIDAGDLFNKGEYAIAYTRGEAMCALVQACEYDACVLGNHDFSFGTRRLVYLIDKFEFPLLAANCQWPKKLRPKNVASYKIFKLEGVTVAVIGTVAQKMNHRSDDLVKVTTAKEAARRLVPQLGKKADIIILITHLGTNFDKDIARSVPGIDLIVGGHDNLCFREMVYDARSQTIIQHSGSGGTCVGEVVLTWDGEKITDRKTRIIDMVKTMPEDPKVKGLRTKYFDNLTKHTEGVEAPKKISRKEWTLWLAEAIKKDTGADVVFIKRKFAGREVAAGKITPRHVLRPTPRNVIICFSVSGQENMNRLLKHIRTKEPDIIVYGQTETLDKSNILVAYPCVRYDKIFKPKDFGLDSTLVANLRRIADRTVWQIALPQVSKQKILVPLSAVEAEPTLISK